MIEPTLREAELREVGERGNFERERVGERAQVSAHRFLHTVHWQLKVVAPQPPSQQQQQ